MIRPRAIATRTLPLAAGSLAIAIAALLAACGDAGSSMAPPGAGSDPSSAPVGPTQGTATPGIGGTIGDGPADAAPPETKAKQLFDGLQSQLVATCGGTGGVCHATGAFQNDQTPVWLAPSDVYASIRKYPGIIVADPYSSKLLLKGPHEGPDFSGPNKALGDLVLTWLTEEAVEIVATALPSTDPFVVQPGPNVVDVSKGGKNVDGATVSFTATITQGIVSLTNLSANAPTTAGLHIAHPIFVVVPSAGPTVPDPVDSLSNVDQTIPAARSVTLGTGTLILENVAPDAKVAIQFNTLEAVAPPPPPDGGADASGGGCKSVAAFTANAVPAIQQNSCLSCHSTGGSGNGALDLSKVGTDDTAACAQALTRVNLATPAQSDILLAPTGGVAAHPFKGASANYVSMMLAWINNE